MYKLTLKVPKMKEVDGHNKPIYCQRVIVETDEKNPKIIAQVTSDNFEVADGLRVRMMPVYKNKD